VRARVRVRVRVLAQEPEQVQGWAREPASVRAWAPVQETAQALGLHDFGANWRSMLASDLSGGQTQKVSIARFWLQVYREGSEGPAALILDEAFTSIDDAGAREAERLTMAKIAEWRARWPEMTVFFTTHDPNALFHRIKVVTFRKNAAGAWEREDHRAMQPDAIREAQSAR
jgi:ABC-type Mn2+/Zn2+ transport system ATPase subunit